jgi:hypothetical protein
MSTEVRAVDDPRVPTVVIVPLSRYHGEARRRRAPLRHYAGRSRCHGRDITSPRPSSCDAGSGVRHTGAVRMRVDMTLAAATVRLQMRRWMPALAAALVLSGCGALDDADQAWQQAHSGYLSCVQAYSIASQIPSPAAYVAEGQCDSAFATALGAITWPNSQLAQEGVAVENDASADAAAEATGDAPSVAQTEQIVADERTLDDDLARERLNQ